MNTECGLTFFFQMYCLLCRLEPCKEIWKSDVVVGFRRFPPYEYHYQAWEADSTLPSHQMSCRMQRFSRNAAFEWKHRSSHGKELEN